MREERQPLRNQDCYPPPRFSTAGHSLVPGKGQILPHQCFLQENDLRLMFCRSNQLHQSSPTLAETGTVPLPDPKSPLLPCHVYEAHTIASAAALPSLLGLGRRQLRFGYHLMPTLSKSLWTLQHRYPTFQ
ncbi:hypothetical protein MTO96_007178 [Rhipicephalus appendiculatus]